MEASRRFTSLLEEDASITNHIQDDKNNGKTNQDDDKRLALLDFINCNVIGARASISTVFGERLVTFADFTASGRALTCVEGYLLQQVLPLYANTHTTASTTGTQTTLFRAEARGIVRRCVGGDSKKDTVIFTGTGCTAAVSHMLHLLTYSPEWLETVPTFPPLVIVGPYEHHSNLLPWRESGARVISLREAAGGGVDMDNLKQVLEANAACPIKVIYFVLC
jgi:selenocysteine lyase/cysteine desulfurase